MLSDGSISYLLIFSPIYMCVINDRLHVSILSRRNSPLVTEPIFLIVYRPLTGAYPAD